MFSQDVKIKHIGLDIPHDSEKSFQINNKIFTGCNTENASMAQQSTLKESLYLRRFLKGIRSLMQLRLSQIIIKLSLLV